VRPSRPAALAFLSALAALAALATAACSGGGDSADPPPTPATSAAASSNEPFCQAARGFVGQMTKIVSEGSDSTRVGPLFQELETFLRQAADTAPGEVRPQAVLAADAVGEFYQALATVDFDQSRVPPEASAKLRSAEFQQATTELATYGRRTCGALG
jgi:hypothetical protein